MRNDRPDRLTLSASQFRVIALITTIGLCFLVVSGGVVRLTGSGLGCNDWPNCNDQSFVDVSTWHAAVEQINRLLSGVIGIPALLMIVGSFRVRPPRAWFGRTSLVAPSLGVLLTVMANAVVGGMAVRAKLHPALVQSHFLLAMASIAFGLVAVRRSKLATGRLDQPTPRLTALAYGLVVTTAVAIVAGTVVTGTGPHAGDQNVRRWGFDISEVTRVHSSAVFIAVFVALGLALQLRREPPNVAAALRPTLSTWIFLAILQGGIGYLQYFTGVPEALVAAHIAGATALWVATVWLFTGVRILDGAPGSGDSAADVSEISQPLSRSM